MNELKPNKKLSKITPKQMTSVFNNNAPLQAKILSREFLGLHINVSGIILTMEDENDQYVSFLFYNEKDKISVIANFDKPIEKELLALNIGDKIRLNGDVFNISAAGIVLDHCELQNDEDDKKNIQNITVNKIFNHSGIGDNIGENKMVEGGKIDQSKKWYQDPIIIISLLSLLVMIISIPWWSTWKNSFQNNKADKREQKELIASSTPEKRNNTVSLRKLDPLETGKKISDLPNGVYFFSNPLAIEYEIEDPKLDFIKASNEYSNNFSFEIQKEDNRYYLVGFIQDEAYSQIGSVSSKNSLYTILFPNQWGSAMHPVKIPFDSIYTIKNREINIDEKAKMYVFDIGFNQIMDNPEVHM